MKLLKNIKLITISVLIGLVIGGYFIISTLSGYYSNKVEIIEVPILPEENINTILPEIEASETIDARLFKLDSILKRDIKKEGILNILLVGLDARDYDTYSRSDTMILVSYDMTTQDIKLVSFMRDNWVYLTDRGWSRINAATAYGGVGLLINTINDNFDLDIQNYVQIKFDDFKKVIDILGGVDVELTQAEIDYINGKLHSDDGDWNNDITSEPGIVHLNGSQALWHCRNRSIGNSDFSRTERQRIVLSLLIEKVKTMSPTEIISLVYQMKDYVNMNIPLDTILSLVNSVVNLNDIEVESYSIPFDGMFKFANKNGASVIELDLEENAMKLHEILGLDPNAVEIKNFSDGYTSNSYKGNSNNVSKPDIYVEDKVDTETSKIEDTAIDIESNETDDSIEKESEISSTEPMDSGDTDDKNIDDSVKDDISVDNETLLDNETSVDNNISDAEVVDKQNSNNSNEIIDN